MKSIVKSLALGGGRLCLAFFYAVIFGGVPAPVSQSRVVPPLSRPRRTEADDCFPNAELVICASYTVSRLDRLLVVPFRLSRVVGLQVLDLINPLILYAPTL